MKRYINYLAILTISSILLTACNKDNFNYKAGYVGQSKITNYAVFAVKGATAVSGGVDRPRQSPREGQPAYFLPTLSCS